MKMDKDSDEYLKDAVEVDLDDEAEMDESNQKNTHFDALSS